MVELFSEQRDWRAWRTRRKGDFVWLNPISPK